MQNKKRQRANWDLAPGLTKLNRDQLVKQGVDWRLLMVVSLVLNWGIPRAQVVHVQNRLTSPRRRVPIIPSPLGTTSRSAGNQSQPALWLLFEPLDERMRYPVLCRALEQCDVGRTIA
jgi:hypothetical protein